MWQVRSGIILCVVIFCLCVSNVLGNTWYVDNDAPGDPDPNNPLVSDPLEDGGSDHPFDAIQEAINISQGGDTILVLDGIYTGVGNYNIEGNGEAITIRSENGPNHSIVDCQGTNLDIRRGFRFYMGENRQTILDGFTITNGNVYRDHLVNPPIYRPGGGIYCEFLSSPTIKNCYLTYNTGASFGGGINTGTGSPLIKNCVFIRNTAGKGGAISCGSQTEIEQCKFFHNGANYGGGVRYSGAPIIRNCIFSENNALYGGAISTYQDNGIITHCTLWNNTATTTNCQFYGNFSNTRIINSVICGTEPSIETEYGNIIFVSYCNIQGGYGGPGNIDVVPNFLDAPNHDFRLDPNSPCIDRGTNLPFGGLSSFDYSGQNRVQDGDGDFNCVVDMGAHEYTYPGMSSLIVSVPRKPHFISNAGSHNPPDQVLQIWNGGNGDLHCEIHENGEWLELDPNTGICEDDHPFVNVTLSAETENLNEGTYSCYLIVISESAANSPLIIPVTLQIYSSGTRLVPQDYETIQDGVDASEPNDTVVVLAGIYTGEGNRNIDYRGKAITVRSLDPNKSDLVDQTIVNCVSPELDQRGFCFQTGEGPDSVLEGFTIVNGHHTGSGIYCNGANPTIRNCNIRSCRMNSIYISNNTTQKPITIRNCYIQSTMGDPEDFWGAVFVYCSRINLIDCIISNNQIHGVLADQGTVILHNTQVIHNEGWGIDCNGTLEIRNSIIQGNKGGIQTGSYGGIITQSIIQDNRSINDGGGIWVGGVIYGQHLSIEDCIIRDNEAVENGGGLYLSDLYWGSTSITLHNCTLEGNSAVRGGGLYNQAYQPIIENCRFEDNQASEQGGAVYTDEDCQPQIKDCVFISNQAKKDGGGMYNTLNSNPELSNCLFSGNIAHAGGSEGGGAVYNNNCRTVFKHCRFERNHVVKGKGGGVFNTNTEAEFYHSEFIENLGMPGAMYATSDSIISCLHCNFARNRDIGIQCDWPSIIHLDNCTFSENTSLVYGGALHLPDGVAKVKNCIIWGNGKEEISYRNVPVEISYSNIRGNWPGEGNIDQTPEFAQIRDPNWLSYWSFNEGDGSVAYDLFGYNIGFVTGPDWAEGVAGNAIRLDGINDYVRINQEYTRLNHVSEFSLSFWVKAASLPFTNYDGVIGFGTNTQRTPWIYGENGTSNLIIDFETTTGGGQDCLLHIGTLEEDAWTYVVVTWDGSTCKAYLNGQYSNEDEAIGSVLAENIASNNYIGYIDGFGYWNGAIDEIQIFGKVLTETEIQQSYQAGLAGYNYFAEIEPEGDYHLQSEFGRWNPNSESWVRDSVTSPCIDAGYRNSDWSNELWPHGGRVNMGLYGGTAEASMSTNISVGNIADLNLDGKVNLLDYDRLTDWWREEEFLLKEDLSRNGQVDAADLEIFLNHWLWHEE